MSASTETRRLAHALKPMKGRDPNESGRVATPLELLFDLTFVIAFANAGNEMAHAIAAGHIATGVGGFCFAIFATCWAWINFSWFASAFDTDDWAYRLLTMVQMIGVLILALGLPSAFSTLESGGHVQTKVLVAGYVVMRVAMLTQWLRAAKQHPALARNCYTYAAAICIAQVGWVILAIAAPTVPVFGLTGFFLMMVEMSGPVIAERIGKGTPWHAHHIAERYGALAIITLGEAVVGTVAGLGAATAEGGWDIEAGTIAIAGMGLTFAMWWIYFEMPGGPILHAHRERSFVFGYAHMLVFGAIAAVGSGLHVVAYFLDASHEPEEYSWVHLDERAAVLAVAIPVVVFIVMIYVLWTYLTRQLDWLHAGLLAATAFVIVATVWMAAHGTPLALCLVVLCLAPTITVLGYEFAGHRHQAQAVAEQTRGHDN